MAHGSSGSIDYVALHANRRQRRVYMRGIDRQYDESTGDSMVRARHHPPPPAELRRQTVPERPEVHVHSGHHKVAAIVHSPQHKVPLGIVFHAVHTGFILEDLVVTFHAPLSERELYAVVNMSVRYS